MLQKNRVMYCVFVISFFLVLYAKADFFSAFGDLITGNADPNIVDIPNFRSTVTTCSSLERARVSALIELKKDHIKEKAALRIKHIGKDANKDLEKAEADVLADLYHQGNRMKHTVGELCGLKYGSVEDQKKYTDRCLIPNDDGDDIQNEVIRCDLVEPGDPIPISHSEILCAPNSTVVSLVKAQLDKAKVLAVQLKINADKNPGNLVLQEKYKEFTDLITHLEHQWSGLETKVTQSNTFLCGDPLKEKNACLIKDPTGVLRQLDPVPGSCKKIDD